MYATDLLHYSGDVVDQLTALGNLLRPGGIMNVSLYNKRFIASVKAARKEFQRHHFSTPMFDNNDVPRLLRIPTEDEIREARKNLLMSIENRKNISREFSDIVASSSFYTLNEFRDLLFHPHVTAFTFTDVNTMLTTTGLQLVGFEFPELLYEKELIYKVEHPEDASMTNGTALDRFDAQEPQAFSGFFITFACQKK